MPGKRAGFIIAQSVLFMFQLLLAMPGFLGTGCGNSIKDIISYQALYSLNKKRVIFLSFKPELQNLSIQSLSPPPPRHPHWYFQHLKLFRMTPTLNPSR